MSGTSRKGVLVGNTMYFGDNLKVLREHVLEKAVGG
jgi:hypothetical protein